MQLPGRAASTGQRRRDATADGANFSAASPASFSSSVIYETNWGKTNAQACECGSAKGEIGSADARNGCGKHNLHGGGGIGAARARGAGGLADSTGDDPAGQAHRRPHAENQGF